MTRKFETVEELVDHVLERTREIFLEQYGIAIREEWKKASPPQSVNLEICVCPEEADGDDIHNLYRFDLILHEQEGKNHFIDISYDLLVKFDPIQFTHGKLTIHLSPFQWLAVEFGMQGELRSRDPLRAWGRKWLLDQGPEQGKPFELANVIHSVSRVKTDDQGRTTFQVDFGTAPKESFWELLDVLEASGVGEVFVDGGFDL